MLSEVRYTTPYNPTWLENQDESCCPFDVAGSDYSLQSLRMTPDRWALHILYPSRCDCTDSSLAGRGALMALHTSVSRKSPDSTQVCSPVSSKGCEEWSQRDEKKNEIYLLPPPLLCTKTSAWAQKNDKVGPRQRHAHKCDDTTGCVWDADEPSGQREWHQCVSLSHLNVALGC